MASHAFGEWSSAANANQPVVRASLRLVEPLFEALELRVIALAKRDSRWSIRPRDRLVKLVERLFGFYRANALADPRLEAIRRFAIATRTTRIRAAETERFLAAGFTAAHADFISHAVTNIPLSSPNKV